MLDPQVRAELLEVSIVKLFTIVRGNGARQAHYILLYEGSYILLGDHCQQFDLRPFHEVANRDHDELGLTFTRWKWAD